VLDERANLLSIRDGPHQRSGAVAVTQIGIGAQCQQLLNACSVGEESGQHEGGDAIRVLHIGICSTSNQSRDLGGVITLNGIEEWLSVVSLGRQCRHDDGGGASEANEAHAGREFHDVPGCEVITPTHILRPSAPQSILTIEGGAFMMLVLPNGEPALNKSYTVNIRQPMPGAPALPCTFKWVGNVTKNGKALRKIMVTMKQTKSNKQGDVTISMTETASGHVLFDAGRGKVMEGAIERSAKQTVKHATEGTRTQNQVSMQSFVKI